jgi:hypothetical protein
VLAEDVVVRDPDGSVRLHHLPLAILTDEDTGHPHRPFPAVRSDEPPAPLHPGDVALDMDVDVIGYRLNLVRTAGGGHGVHDLLARPPLIGVGADVNGIGTL